MVEILWRRRETRRQKEKTNIALRYLEELVYSTPISEDDVFMVGQYHD